MGAFFTNIQIRRGPDVSAGTIERILDSMAGAAGMERCLGDQPADRTIVVRGGPGDWVSVYDEATEGQDTKLLDGLAKALSQGTNTHAVAVLVHDSDVLRLALFENGKGGLRMVEGGPGENPAAGWAVCPDDGRDFASLLEAALKRMEGGAEDALRKGEEEWTATGSLS